MDNNPLRFHRHLEALGTPIHGVSGEGPECRIDFRDEATDEQRAAANAERATFNWGTTPEDRLAIQKADTLAATVTPSRADVMARAAIFRAIFERAEEAAVAAGLPPLTEKEKAARIAAKVDEVYGD